MNFLSENVAITSVITAVALQAIASVLMNVEVQSEVVFD